ncbi:MAG: MotA/TolQ/ExbB proton channel family protein [Bacteroidetes bacterium]|nr:MotA/TolQ/ExbB proton channel family protein [Bacteroidota bacterium]
MNFSFLLQVAPEAGETEKTKTYQSVWDIIDKSNEGLGLIINLIILAMAAWTIFVFIERFLAIRRAVESEKNLLNSVKADLDNNKINEASAKCSLSDSPVAKMLEKGIQKIDRPPSELTSTIENTGKFEVLRLEQRLNSLATMAGAAPMVGFLGTVIGMVSVFYELSESQSLEIKTIAPGIMTAMITTVGGLIVGIIAFMGYNFLVGQIGKVIYRMENAALELVEYAARRKESKAKNMDV